MNILIDIGHPAHVHLFRHYHAQMVSQGHTLLFVSKEKECSIDLLQHYNLPYVSLGKPRCTIAGKLWGLCYFGLKLHKLARKFKADIFLSVSSMYAAHVAFLTRKPHIVLDDTEHSVFEHILYRPFSKVILTPRCFKKDFGRKHVRHDSFHELAYLHPKRFTPDSTIKKTLGIPDNERFVVVRFVAWNAGHDYKQNGLSTTDKISLVHYLNTILHVVISSEGELPANLEKFRIATPAHKIHDVLAVASLYIGEGATMASECTMLGTPAIYINPLSAGTLEEQEGYGSLFSNENMNQIKVLTTKILDTPEQQFKQLQATLLREKIDLTDFLCELTEHTHSLNSNTVITDWKPGKTEHNHVLKKKDVE